MPSTAKYLITGGTGTLGQAITEKLLEKGAGHIRIYSRGELLQAQMKEKFNNPSLRFLIGDVRDRDRLSRAMNSIDYVFHCAALKRVEMCEYNPIEACKTNVMGIVNVIDTAIDNGVKKVLNVSSDKAVHPISVYGSTKLLAEQMVTQSNHYVGDRKTKLSSIRLGNYVGSRGSFIQSLERQKQDGCIKITDKDMTRYWMSIDHAASFSLESLERMEGGEIFIPKIPQASLMAIVNSLAPECKVEIIGKRPGEKLSELLFSENEHPVDMGDYFIIKGVEK